MNPEIKTEDIERQYLSDEAAAEFDRILGQRGKRVAKIRILLWTGGIAAALAIVLLVARPWALDNKEQINPMVIAEGIENLMDLSSDDIASIEAIPKGSKAFLTVRMKDGSTRTFIMTVDNDGTSFKIASNDNKKQ